ncbi:Ldh family oxidoreductase [Candidatus Poribacteria bacterium]|nr:Ldh family oxidoreductase [Candidatus Poribacteria bacterium]
MSTNKSVKNPNVSTLGAVNQREQETIVNADQLQQVCSQLYQKAGVAREYADTIAQMQVLMDLRGVPSHATRGVPGYVRGMINGGTNPNPERLPYSMPIVAWGTLLLSTG